MRSLVSTVVVCTLTTVLAACGDDGAGPAGDGDAAVDAALIDAAPRVIMETRSIVAAQLIEGVMSGGPQDRAVIHLEAPVAELDWNIHGHAGGGTQTVQEGFNQTTVDYVFTPTADTDWWLLLRNSGPSAMNVVVRVELYGDMQWRWE